MVTCWLEPSAQTLRPVCRSLSLDSRPPASPQVRAHTRCRVSGSTDPELSFLIVHSVTGVSLVTQLCFLTYLPTCLLAYLLTCLRVCVLVATVDVVVPVSVCHRGCGTCIGDRISDCLACAAGFSPVGVHGFPTVCLNTSTCTHAHA
jgi:hypothetical protein